MPTRYEEYAAVLYAIQRIGEGLLPTHAVREANIPYKTFRRYVKEDEQLALMLDEAEQQGYDTLADYLLTLNDKDNPYHCSDPKEQKVISDNIKWILARRKQQMYGDRVEIKVEATVEHVIVQQLEQARQRSQQAIEQRTEIIDAEYVMLPPPPPKVPA